jgi:hypothetical protein
MKIAVVLGVLAIFAYVESASVLTDQPAENPVGTTNVDAPEGDSIRQKRDYHSHGPRRKFFE